MIAFSGSLVFLAFWAIHGIVVLTWAHRPSLWTASSSRDDQWILWLQ
jgi:hypothetical protein